MLRQETKKAHTVLRDMKVKPGQRIAILFSNTAAFPIWLMACLEIGTNPVLLGVGTKEAELDILAQKSGIHWAIHNFENPSSNLSEHRKQGMYLGSFGAEKSWLFALSKTKAKNNLEPGALLHPTSGTYGQAQLCIRNQEVAVAEAQNFLEAIRCYDRCRVRITTPLSHAFGFGFGLVATLLSQSNLVLDRIFNPRRLLKMEQKKSSDIISLVPAMINILSSLGQQQQIKLAPVIFYAGASCSAQKQRLFEHNFQTRLYAIYGTTETGAISTNYPANEHKNTGVGSPLPNVDISIRNQSNYRSLKTAVGEVWIRSNSFMQGYLDASVEADEDGFFNTRDLGSLHKDGMLHLVGRIKDMINLGGRKVDPAEVEAVLNGIPYVLEAAVYPGVNHDGMEFVQAAIRLASGHSLQAESLTTICAAQLEPFKLPLHYHQVDALPRSPSGKCLKMQCPNWGTA